MIVKSFRIQSFSRICRLLARGHANPCPRKPRRPQPYFMHDETFSRWCQLLRFPCSPSRLSQSSFGNYRPHGKNESKNESSANCIRVLDFPLAHLIGLLSIHILVALSHTCVRTRRFPGNSWIYAIGCPRDPEMARRKARARDALFWAVNSRASGCPGVKTGKHGQVFTVYTPFVA